jgi:hypothetical protein
VAETGSLSDKTDLNFGGKILAPNFWRQKKRNFWVRRNLRILKVEEGEVCLFVVKTLKKISTKGRISWSRDI